MPETRREVNARGCGERSSPIPNNPVARMAAELIARGFAVCKVKPGKKNPNYTGWNTKSLTPQDFKRAKDSIGIVTGPFSNGGRPGHSLATLDIDCREAVRLADRYLPATRMMDSRPGKLLSHRYFLVPFDSIPEEEYAPADTNASALVATRRFGHPGPRIIVFKSVETRKEVIKFIGTALHTVCPPSVWTASDGTDRTEVRFWDGGGIGEPSVVALPELLGATRALAHACGARSTSCSPTNSSRRVTVSAAQSVKQRLVDNKLVVGMRGGGGCSAAGGVKVTREQREAEREALRQSLSPHLWECVLATQPDAKGQSNDCIFQFARRLKAHTADFPSDLSDDALGARLDALASAWWWCGARHCTRRSERDTQQHLRRAWNSARFSVRDTPFWDEMVEAASCACGDRLAKALAVCRFLTDKNQGGDFFLSGHTLANVLGCSQQTAWRALNKLTDLGRLRVTQRGQASASRRDKPTWYALVF